MRPCLKTTYLYLSVVICRYTSHLNCHIIRHNYYIISLKKMTHLKGFTLSLKWHQHNLPDAFSSGSQTAWNDDSRAVLLSARSKLQAGHIMWAKSKQNKQLGPVLAWHVVIVRPACGSDLAHRRGPPKSHHSTQYVESMCLVCARSGPQQFFCLGIGCYKDSYEDRHQNTWTTHIWLSWKTTATCVTVTSHPDGNRVFDNKRICCFLSLCYKSLRGSGPELLLHLSCV